jgi:hypothetical protein
MALHRHPPPRCAGTAGVPKRATVRVARGRHTEAGPSSGRRARRHGNGAAGRFHAHVRAAPRRASPTPGATRPGRHTGTAAEPKSAVTHAPHRTTGQNPPHGNGAAGRFRARVRAARARPRRARSSSPAQGQGAVLRCPSPARCRTCVALRSAVGPGLPEGAGETSRCCQGRRMRARRRAGPACPAGLGTAYRTSPQRKPSATAWARSEAPSFLNRRRACVLTVSSERKSSRPISALERP